MRALVVLLLILSGRSACGAGKDSYGFGQSYTLGRCR